MYGVSRQVWGKDILVAWVYLDEVALAQIGLAYAERRDICPKQTPRKCGKRKKRVYTKPQLRRPTPTVRDDGIPKGDRTNILDHPQLGPASRTLIL